MVDEDALGRLKAYEERLKAHEPSNNGDGKLLLRQEECEPVKKKKRVNLPM